MLSQKTLERELDEATRAIEEMITIRMVSCIEINTKEDVTMLTITMTLRPLVLMMKRIFS